MEISNRNKWIAVISFILIIGILAALIIEKDSPPISRTGGNILKELPESFTFFDLGSNTRYNDTIRSVLSQSLGSDAIAYKSQIDLTINSSEFLQTFFPEIFKLNLILNYPPRERVEHNIIKLMYRYSKKIGVPFKYVELVFSGYSQRPLYFKIIVSHDGASVIDSLHQKYGTPQKVEEPAQNISSSFWIKNKDTLIVYNQKDRFGNPEYHIMIYFVNSIEELIDIVKKDAQKREDRVRKAGDKAF